MTACGLLDWDRAVSGLRSLRIEVRAKELLEGLHYSGAGVSFVGAGRPMPPPAFAQSEILLVEIGTAMRRFLVPEVGVTVVSSSLEFLATELLR